MQNMENYFTAAIRLLQGHEASNEPVTGRTLLSLLTILERNEAQHTRDFAALDALTRTLTSVVSHMVESAIADDEAQVVLAQLESLSERVEDGRLRDVSDAFDADHARPDNGRQRREVVTSLAGRERASGVTKMPKRSFSDVVADIGRRHPPRHGLVLEHEEIQPAPAALEPVAADEEVADQDALQTIFGELDRLTTEMERSERVLASLPTLVDSVQGLIEECQAPAANGTLEGARRAQHELAEALGRRVISAGQATSEAHDNESNPTAIVRLLPPATLARGPGRSAGKTNRADGASASAALSAAGAHAGGRRPALDGSLPRRLFSLGGGALGARRWQGFASVCALFVALSATAVIQVANSHADTDVRPLQAQAAGAADPAARMNLLSGERIEREPSKLTLPLLAEGVDPGTLRHKAVLASSGVQAATYYQLGLRSLGGRGGPQDYKLAACFFEHAADAGSAPAQYRLAVMLERGVGTPKDLGKARDLYRRAALAGHVHAMHNLAVLLSADKRASAYGDAAFWFARAAHSGVIDSQYNLGMLFAQGLGVKRSPLQAFEWFAIAAGQGDKGALAKRDELASHLSAADLKESRRFAAAFTPDVPDAEANGLSPGGADAGLQQTSIAALTDTCSVTPDQRLRYSMR